MITYSYKSPIRNLFFGIMLLIPCYFFLLTIIKVDSWAIRIALFFLILTFSFCSIAFFLFYLRNRKRKKIILNKEKMILPIKSGMKEQSISYDKIVDVYVTKEAPDMFSIFERNIVIQTKVWYIYIEKRWMRNKKEFYSLLDNLQEKANVERNNKTRK